MVGREVVGGCHLRGHFPGYPWHTSSILLLLAHQHAALGIIWGGPRVVESGYGTHSKLPLAHRDGAAAVCSYWWRTIPVR
jgi:hypothetical protein